MNDILEEIVRKKKASVEERKKSVTLDALKERLAGRVRRDFRKAVGKRRGVNIIAEIKKASPSAGLIREDFDPEQIAREYSAGGAAAISVLTEQEHFKGDISYLGSVRNVSPLPLLRKDFIFDAYQVFEAAAFGADAVLLIAAILAGGELKKLIVTSKELDICPLVEIHDKSELQKALEAGADVIGINNRNLKDLSLNVHAAAALITEIPKDKVIIVESGIRTPRDVRMYLDKGVNAFLVGEALMRGKDITACLKELING